MTNNVTWWPDLMLNTMDGGMMGGSVFGWAFVFFHSAIGIGPSPIWLLVHMSLNILSCFYINFSSRRSLWMIFYFYTMPLATIFFSLHQTKSPPSVAHRSVLGLTARYRPRSARSARRALRLVIRTQCCHSQFSVFFISLKYSATTRARWSNSFRGSNRYLRMSFKK